MKSNVIYPSVQHPTILLYGMDLPFQVENLIWLIFGLVSTLYTLKIMLITSISAMFDTITLMSLPHPSSRDLIK